MKKDVLKKILIVVFIIAIIVVIVFLIVKSNLNNEEVSDSVNESIVDTVVTEAPTSEPTTLPTEAPTEIPQFTFIDVNETYWTTEEAVLYLDCEGNIEDGTLPPNNQIFVTRQCVETGFCESADEVGTFYIHIEVLSKEPINTQETEMPEETKESDESKDNKVDVVEPSQPTENEVVPVDPQPETIPTEDPNGNISILEPEPEGGYTPSTYEENGYTFLDLGMIILSWNGEKTMYTDLTLTDTMGTKNGDGITQIGTRQCIETGAIEIWGGSKGNYWISSDGVRLGY